MTKALGIGRPCGCWRGCLDITSGMEDQLQIRLQQRPWRNPGFVRNFECALVIAYRTLDAGEENLIPVQEAGIANPPINYICQYAAGFVNSSFGCPDTLSDDCQAVAPAIHLRR